MNAATGTNGGGLRGANASLPLVDLLQVWSLNHFSGLVSVGSMGREGKLHFADGEIVHAEADGQEGELAVRVILSWSDIGFESFPNTTTLKRTIRKKVSHLLLDAHRELDEARRNPPALTPPPQAAKPSAPSSPSLMDQLRALRGVTGLVRFLADGQPFGAGAGEPGAEALAAKGLYLALTHAAVVGQAFGLRDFWLAALESPRESFVVIRSGDQYLGVAVAQGVQVDPLIGQIRTLLTQAASR
jgi:hypothetical protein